MAAYYWVGGAGQWTNTARWATSSGGTSGNGPPTSADSVIFDNLSGSGLCQVYGNVNCLNFTVTSNCNINFSGSGNIHVAGNLTIAKTTIIFYSGFGSFFFETTGTANISAQNNYAASYTLPNLYFGGSGTYNLQNNLGANEIYLSSGTLNTNNYTVSITRFYTGSTNPRTLNLGSSQVSSNYFDFSDSTSQNFTFNAGTSTITLTYRLTAINYTFYNLVVVPNTDFTIAGSNTFNNLTLNPIPLDYLVICNVQGTLTINGSFTVNSGNTNAARRWKITGDFTADAITQTQINASSVSLTDVDFRLIKAGSTWSGTRLGDCGGNSNITFPAAKTVYWNKPAGGNFSTSLFAASPGGSTSTANFPLPQDTIVIGGAQTPGITITNDYYSIGTLDCSSATTAFIFISYQNVYGNVILNSFVTGTGLALVMSGINKSQSVTLGGCTIANLQIQAYNSTVTVNDNLTCTSGISIYFGNLTVNNCNVSTNGFFVGEYGTIITTYISSQKTINMGSGTWTITVGNSWQVTDNKTTINGINSTLIFDSSAYGEGSSSITLETQGGTYGSVTCVNNLGGYFEIDNSGSSPSYINNLSMDPNQCNNLSFGNTTVGTNIVNFNINGQNGNLMYITSPNPSSTSFVNILKLTQVNYVSIAGLTVPEGTLYALNSIDNTLNVNVNFDVPVPFGRILQMF